MNTTCGACDLIHLAVFCSTSTILDLLIIALCGRPPPRPGLEHIYITSRHMTGSKIFPYTVVVSVKERIEFIFIKFQKHF